MIHLNDRAGAQVRAAARQLPYVQVHTTLKPIMADYVQAELTIVPEFEWNERVHHGQEPLFVWIEQGSDQTILQSRAIHLHPNQKVVRATFLFPLDPTQTSLSLRWMSDRWIGAEDEQVISLTGLVWPLFPEAQPTDALDLPLVPTSDLLPATLAATFDAAPLGWGGTFNPLQTRALHTILRTQRNTLLAFPARSGGTTTMALSLFPFYQSLAAKDGSGTAKSTKRALFLGPDPARLWSDFRSLTPWIKAVATLNNDLRTTLTAASSATALAQASARVVFSTPKIVLQWVLTFVSGAGTKGLQPDQLGLILLDSLHLLTPEYELAISLLRLAAPHARIVASSAALADAAGVAKWLGVDSMGLYTFPPPLRPVGIQHSLVPVDGTHSHALLQTMVKPAFDAVKNLVLPAVSDGETDKVGAALLFTPSRSAAQVVADGLATLAAGELDPLSGVAWIQLSQAALEYTLVAHGVTSDSLLTRTLPHGVAVYDDSMLNSEKKLVLSLFETRSIRALVLPRWAAWGTNLRAHLVVVLGTQYVRLPPRLDLGVQQPGTKLLPNRAHEVVDYPASDVVRMHSLVSNPSARFSGNHVVILCQPFQVSYYDAVLRQGTPLESNLLETILPRDKADAPLVGSWASVLLGLIVGGQGLSRQDALDLWGWTLASVRTRSNPSYYGLSSGTSPSAFAQYITDAVLDSLVGLGLVKEHLVTGNRTTTVVVRTPLGDKLWPVGETLQGKHVAHLRSLLRLVTHDRTQLATILQVLDQPRTGIVTLAQANPQVGSKTLKAEDVYSSTLNALTRDALRATGLDERKKSKKEKVAEARADAAQADTETETDGTRVEAVPHPPTKAKGSKDVNHQNEWTDSAVRRLFLARWFSRSSRSDRRVTMGSKLESVLDQLEADVVLAVASAAAGSVPRSSG